MKKLRSRYEDTRLWYLEVVAVHPSLQSRGLGGSVMRWIIEYTQNQPIVLECTRESNVPFYERYGFKVVEEVELTDEPQPQESGGTVKYWVMVRE
jgi:ribosomal protein S18 acetylase RimI-like enzyme